MNTLAFDACFGACSVAVTWRDDSRDGWQGAFRGEQLLRGHAERLMPMIAEAMAEAPFGFEDLQRIVVTDGPGTFTGQRVGIAAARAFSLATGAPVHVLSSLAVMAYGAAATLGDEAAGRTIAVAVDARRGEIYFQAFDDAGRAALDEPALLTPEAAARRLGKRAAVAVGSGASLVAEAAGAAGGSVTATLPALEPDVRFIPFTVFPPPCALPRPRYLRPPDAKPQDGASLVRPT